MGVLKPTSGDILRKGCFFKVKQLSTAKILTHSQNKTSLSPTLSCSYQSIHPEVKTVLTILGLLAPKSYT